MIREEWAWRWRAYRPRGDYSREGILAIWKRVYSPIYRVD